MQGPLNIAIQAARAAGDLSVRYMDRLDKVKVSEKSPNDFVSDIDRECEAIIIETIRKAFPAHSVLGEESGKHGDNETEWVIDPLDGTLNYLHSIPHFSVSIAMRVKQRLEVGVVYDPVKQELFTATRGNGAQLNEKRIRASSRRSLDGAVLGTGFPFGQMDDLDRYMQVMSALMPRAAGLRRAGSAALDLAYGLLDGRADDPFALANAGHILAYLGGEPELGYKALQQAGALNPNSVMVRSSLGWVCNYSGRYEEAVTHFEACYRLNPLHPNAAHARSGHGYAFIGLKRYGEAVTLLEEALTEDPGFGSTTQALVVAYELAGRHDDAVALNATYKSAAPQVSLSYYLKNTPFIDPEFKDRYSDALRAAGLTE